MIECTVAHARHAAAYFKFDDPRHVVFTDKSAASGKRPIPDFGNAVGYIDLFQFDAIIECRIAYRLYAFTEIQTFQTGTVAKRL